MENVFMLNYFHQNPRQNVLVPLQKYWILLRIITGIKAAYEMKKILIMKLQVCVINLIYKYTWGTILILFFNQNSLI